MFQHQVVSMSRRGLGVVCGSCPGAETALVSSLIVRSCVGAQPWSRPSYKQAAQQILFCIEIYTLGCPYIVFSMSKVFQLCLVLAPRKIPCRYGRLIERLLLKVIAKQSLVLPMYLRHFKTLLCWPRPDRPCVHLTIVWWTWPLWKPVPCQRWHWHGWELWRSGTLGCQLLSWTWSRPRWLTLGLGAIQ